MSPLFFASLRPLMLPFLALSLGLAGAAHGERGGNGLGIGIGNGNGNGNGLGISVGGTGVGAGNSQSRPSAPQANVAANPTSDNSMPQRLNAYKAAYQKAAIEVAAAQSYYEQYQAVSAISETEFLAAYPGADYQATLSHLAAQYNSHRALAETANADAQASLAAVTAGRTLSASGLAELHQMLGL